MHYNSLTTTSLEENPAYLSEQLITYIGNKRALLNFIGAGLAKIKTRLNKDKLNCFDAFSGSGIVSRFLKQHSINLYVNDLEKYSGIINECYLTNKSEFNFNEFKSIYDELISRLVEQNLKPGLISKLYAPEDDNNIKAGERVFYTKRNAQFIDTARQLIGKVEEKYQKYLLAPLLSEASIHANTAGVFKGFYKNPNTGLGQFGGKNRDALLRIMSPISIPFPVFSNYECNYQVYTEDTNKICKSLPELDVAYLDPPYNQHPYGSNYFMLNLIIDYKPPEKHSDVSGIPVNWNRSDYNKRSYAFYALKELIENTNSKFLLISFNSEGFISKQDLMQLLKTHGKLSIMETKYNTFRASRNLNNRSIHVKEYLYLLEK